jgi:Flp pilus assembly protein TadD
VRKTDDANAAIGQLDFARAAADASSAHSLNPLALDPLYALGLAETLRGRLAEAQLAYARAVRDQPDNPEPWFNLGDFELQAGDRKTACAFLKQATVLDPFDKTAVAERTEACAPKR